MTTSGSPDVSHPEATPLIAGVDIGGTNTSVGLIRPDGVLIAQRTIPTRAAEPADAFVPRLAALVTEMCADAGGGAVLTAAGVAAPAASAREGLLDNPANLAWGRVPIADMLRTVLHVPVVVLKDSHAATLGEQRFGAAQGMMNFVLITLGTGLGAGVVVNGSLLEGAHGIASEFGHMILEPGGRLCGCGRRGCVETYVSATGLSRTLLESFALDTAESRLRGQSLATLSGRSIYDAALDHDTIALAALERTGEALGRFLADIAAAFDPEAIILYGGLVNAGELLLTPTRTSFAAHLLTMYRGKVAIIPSPLNNGKAAVLGAAWKAVTALPAKKFDNTDSAGRFQR